MAKIKNYINKFQYYIGFVVAFILGLTPLLWFKGQMIAGEEFYSLDYAKWGRMFSNTWFDRVDFGEFGALIPFKLQQMFFEVLYFVGMNRYYALVLWHVSLFLLSSVSFYLLVLLVFKRKYSVFHYLFGVLFYLYNPFFLNISPFLSPPRILFTFLPVILIIFYKNFTAPHKSLLYASLLNIVLVIVSPIFVNVPLGIALLAFCGIFYVSLFILTKQSYLNIAKISLFFAILYLAFNIWWLLPTAYRQLQNLGEVRGEASTFLSINQTKTTDALSLFGSWAFRDTIYNTGIHYFPYYSVFDTFPGSFLRFVPFILIILGLYRLAKVKDKHTVENEKLFYFFISLTYLIFLFLSKGVSPPLGKIYELLYIHFPAFWMYREPYAKFIPFAAVTGSVLLVIGSGYLFESIRAIKIKYLKVLGALFLYGIITISLGLLGFFFVSREIVWQLNSGQTRSYLVSMPPGWSQIISEWKPKSGYYFTYPSRGFFDLYLWPSGYAGNPYLMLTDAKIVNNDFGYSSSENPERKIVTNYLLNIMLNNPQKFLDECSRYDMSGVILQKDIYFPGAGYTSGVIENNFKNLSVLSNADASIFECPVGAAKKISIFSPDSIINIAPSVFSNYTNFRSVLEKNNIFNILPNDSASSDVGFLTPQLGNAQSEIVYPVTTQVDERTKFYLIDNTNNIKSVDIDGKTPKGGFFNKVLTIMPVDYTGCCKDVRVELNTGPLLPMKLSDTTWYKSDRHSSTFTPLPENKVIDDRLVIGDANAYYTKIDNFDMGSAYQIGLNLKSASANLPIGMSIVQVSKTNNLLNYLVSYSVKDISKSPLIFYEGPKYNQINFLGDSDYYLAIYGIPLSDSSGHTISYPDNSFIVPANVTMAKTAYPYVFYIKSSPTSQEYPIITDYSEQGTSLIFASLRTDVIKDSILQFKNSYNKDWRLVPLTHWQYIDYAKGNLNFLSSLSLLRSALKSAPPLNLEYYSNGWEVHANSDETYFVVVFWPTLFADVLLKVSIWAIILVSLTVVFTYRKRLLPK